jgi:magnesium transporter
MPKSKKKKGKGLPPGSVVYTGSKLNDYQLWIHKLQFDGEVLINESFESPEYHTFDIEDNGRIYWFDIRGIHNTDLIKEIGEKFQIHNLVLEDIVNVYQRPKFDDFETGIFLTFKAIKLKEKTCELVTEQLSIYFNERILISFQEHEDDTFEGIRTRIDNAKGRIRAKGTDYLAFALIDCIVDEYFDALDQTDDFIDVLEAQLVNNEDISLKLKIHQVRNEVMSFRSHALPLRELINRFLKSENELVQDSTRVYLRDLQDHVAQVLDIIENQRETLHGLTDLLMSNVSNKMNQVMKTLTMISTIFIPLTFLAGIYGMNFENIPELKSQNGYYILLGIMALMTGLMVWYFKRKKWI